ncbi:receptor kinase-like protein Xa21 isoform X2 [Miscanthus floridulus]|uniref:receptor kinase-like protein Xa21 isoform X2 n=1 Tax=Miscanthus floridulus TaxID=154761 RepID=UPI00345A4A17
MAATLHSMLTLVLLVLLTVWPADSSSLVGKHGDREALLAFKEALSDDSGSLRSWNGSSSDFCRWPGVTCSRRHPGRVVSLRLSYCNLGGTISPVIGNLTFLRTLDIEGNMLSGDIPHTINRLHRLRSLQLGNNSLAGEIPAGLANCSNLVFLDLGMNLIRGGIPSGLGSLSQLQTLYVDENNLVGHIPPSLGNVSLLEGISLFYNTLEGTIPEGLSRLRYLQFIQAGRNNLTGTIPPLFFNISSLQYFGFSSNNLHGRLPPDAGRHLPDLEVLLLGGARNKNSFSGTLPASLSNATKLQQLVVANNHFGGRVPPEIGTLCPVLVEMGNNMLKAEDDAGWEFLRYFTNCTRLEVLDVSNNTLGGVLPSFVANFTGPIQLLLMSMNGMSGVIPPGIGNLISLEDLEFTGNNLHGVIPEDIGRLQNLKIFTLEANLLSGGIPPSFGNLTELLTLKLSNNELNGSIPENLGSLHSLKHATTLDLSKNNLSGEVPGALGDCASLVYLSLDDNYFTGSIPPSIGNLKGLSMLNFTRNGLSGSIPQELSKIHGLQKLYLAHNYLSGAIPQLLQNSSALVELDLSYNHLEELKLPPCEVKPHCSHRKRLQLKIFLPTAGIAICFSLLLVALFLFKGRKGLDRINATQNHLLDNKYPRVSYLQLFEATDGFAPTNLIGAGKYGSVYKGNLSLTSARDSVVAVKVFAPQQPGSSRSFLAECEALRQVKHRNLINIITCCSSIDSRGNDFQALVFDFMPRYSLDRWLHPRSNEQTHKLSLTQLMNIATDVADALDYLHNSSCPTVVHCDLKPSNILLGSDWTAYVADFGLAKLIGESMDRSNLNIGTESTIGIRGTIGYAAPEYGAGGQASVAGDAYSFGVTLLEMFTGKAPIDGMFIDGLTLQLLAEAGLPDKISEIIDPELLHDEVHDNGSGILSCLASVVGVGISCSKDNPSNRMNMKDAAAELHRIKEYLQKSLRT